METFTYTRKASSPTRVAIASLIGIRRFGNRFRCLPCNCENMDCNCNGIVTGEQCQENANPASHIMWVGTLCDNCATQMPREYHMEDCKCVQCNYLNDVALDVALEMRFNEAQVSFGNMDWVEDSQSHLRRKIMRAPDSEVWISCEINGHKWVVFENWPYEGRHGFDNSGYITE